jgi:hypothetical protein
MKNTIDPMKNTTTISLAVLGMLALPASAVVSQLGILDLMANGGINPNTGNSWQVGDQYRLAFHTDGTIPGTANDPAFYDGFATTQANLSTLGNGAIQSLSGWTALVWVNTDPSVAQGDALSDPTVRAGINDLTGGAGVGGAGVPVYAMDGATAIARNNADIDNSWSNPFDGDATIRLASGTTNNNSSGDPVTASQNVYYSPFLDQFALGDTANIHGADIMTGGIFDSHVNAAGDTIDDTTFSRGASNANSAGRVWNRFTDATTEERSVYAISPLLTVAVPEPSTGLLGLLGGLFLLRRRRK